MTNKIPLFPNYAGRSDVDEALSAELECASIIIHTLPKMLRNEVETSIVGGLHGWTFQRAWYYWKAKEPGIPPDDAERLHKTHGQEVRVDGHCMCPSPGEWFKGFAVGSYHVDTQRGLCALANTIREVAKRYEERSRLDKDKLL